MEVFFSPYHLFPARRANHLDDLSPKSGIYLKTNNQFELADYFPHENLGDQSVENFIKTFPDLNNHYHLSILNQLKTKKTPLPVTPFLNHQLWSTGSEVSSPVVKYKIMSKDDFIPEKILNSNCRIRLDANGIFEDQEVFKFLSRLDILQISRIDYIEDPSNNSPWTDIPIPTAQDFIPGHTYQTLIYKPNRTYHTQVPTNTIFSGYMGSPLGLLHVYRELIKHGDLTSFHGILTPGAYKDEETLFSGSYSRGFMPDPQEINRYTEKVLDQEWSHLCFI